MSLYINVSVVKLPSKWVLSLGWGEYQMYGNGKIWGSYNCFCYLKVLTNTGLNIVCIEFTAVSFWHWLLPLKWAPPPSPPSPPKINQSEAVEESLHFLHYKSGCWYWKGKVCTSKKFGFFVVLVLVAEIKKVCLRLKELVWVTLEQFSY